MPRLFLGGLWASHKYLQMVFREIDSLLKNILQIRNKAQIPLKQFIFGQINHKL